MDIKNNTAVTMGRMALLSFIIIPALSGCLAGDKQTKSTVKESSSALNTVKIDTHNNTQDTRPNIVFIMSDDHSERAISAYGSKLIDTPNIDRIANEGVRFNNSFVANSICGPSRAVMLTGKHSHINGFTDNHSRFDGNQPTYPQYLQKSGYQTAVVGKWPVSYTHLTLPTIYSV